MQHEVGVRNLEILNNSTDAKGRKLEVFKVHVPPPLFRKYKEAEGVHVSLQSTPALLSLPLGVCYNVTLPNTLIFPTQYAHAQHHLLLHSAPFLAGHTVQHLGDGHILATVLGTQADT